MKIIQFTDIHIGRLQEDTRGVDVRSNLEKLLTHLQGVSYDTAVLSGDLCFKGASEAIYGYISTRLDEYGLEPLIISGNHDDSLLLASSFDLELHGREIYYQRELGGYQVLFLDTAVGEMSGEQWDWLKARSNERSDTLVIFMHHPPLECGVPYMDINHRFMQWEPFEAFRSEVSREIQVFCGHYHVERTISRDNLHVHITPSTFFQIRSDIVDFGVDHYRIGYREIILGESVQHRVTYL